MADYIFNVYLNTDRGEFSVDYSLSEYIYNLPSFYFALNEYVSAKAEINILNSSFLCIGASIYNATASLKTASTQTSILGKTATYTPMVYIAMNSEALVEVSSIRYCIINGKIWLRAYVIAVFV
jgi:hypothetical protein